MDKKEGMRSKKVQVTLDAGIYEIVEELKVKVYKTDSDSKVCSSIIEAFLNEHGYTRAKLDQE
jgi:CRISPR/Cas system-associated protein Csm6